MREVRISCPDATGLGCDIARMLLDFGLRILTGDLSTDGTWCYLVFVVRTANHVAALTLSPCSTCFPAVTWCCLLMYAIGMRVTHCDRDSCADACCLTSAGKFLQQLGHAESGS